MNKKTGFFRVDHSELKVGNKVRFIMYFSYIKPSISRKLVYNPPLDWADEIVNTGAERNTRGQLTLTFQLKNWCRGFHKHGEEIFFKEGFLEKI